MNKTLKKLLILPLCASALSIGYIISDRKTEDYFHPTPETKTLQDIIKVMGPAPLYYKETTAGQYLSANFAQRHKDWKTASDYLHKIIVREENNTALEKQAMILAMGSGEVNRAIALAREVKETAPDNILATLFLVMDSFKRGEYKQAHTILSEVPDNSLGGFITPVLKTWAKAAQGEFDINDVPPNSLYAYHVLLIGHLTNNMKQANDFVDKSLTSADVDPNDLLRIADFYASLEQGEKAKKLYAMIMNSGYGTSELKKRLQALSPDSEVTTENIHDLIRVPDVQNAQEGVALVFLNMSEILARDYSDDSTMIFANMALHLSSKLDKAHVILGTVLTRHDRKEEAIKHFEKVPPKSDYYEMARMEIADLYVNLEQNEKAISLLEDLYRETQNVNAIIQIGHIHRVTEDFSAAINAYNKAASIIGAPVSEDYWHLLYARGMAFEQTKQFQKSEDDLLKALAFQPNHPYILNYLGYSWADQGKNLEKSLEMLEKAARLKPNDGHIADSLGWVLYRMGKKEEAIPHLELAVQLEPYDPIINDHLGDAYWQTGRFIEARFQWERSYNHAEDIDLKIALETKIKYGLDALHDEKENHMTAANDHDAITPHHE